MSKMRLTEAERSERLEKLHGELGAAVAALTTSDAWLTYLRTMRRFHTYSAQNTLLILSQRPDATQVAGFHTWKSLGRSVKKGAKGIGIFAPLARKVEVTDAATGESESKRGIGGFRIVWVFDVADTEGEPLAEEGVRPMLIEGQAPDGMWLDLVAQVAAAGFVTETVEEIDHQPETNGQTDFDARTVQIAVAGRSRASQCRTLAHELAHVLLHGDYATPRAIAEVEAESVAFLVADAWGIDGSAYSVPYVANWGLSDPGAVLATADRVLRTSRAILADRDGAEEVAA